VVPREAAPYLVVALSFRVKPWIERVSRVADVLHTPRIGLKAAQQIAATQADAAVGVVDFDGLPAGIAEDLREGGPALAWRDASALFTALRGVADRRKSLWQQKPPRSAIARLPLPKARISTR